MEVLQGNSLCSYLKQAKMSFAFFCKTGEQEGKTGPAWQGKGEVGKGHGRVNIVQIQCTHVSK
jgi:hypothetical protein